MEEKEKTMAVDMNANGANAKGDASANGANSNAKKNDKDKKKKAGIIIGVVGLSVAAAIAAAAGAKGCAPNERSYTITYLTDDEVQNFQGGSFSVKEGTTIGDLKRQLAPLDGYEVEGFYKDPDCTLYFKDDETVTNDTKIYINYQQIEATVKFYKSRDLFNHESNAGAGDIKEIKVKYFDKLTAEDLMEIEQVKPKDYEKESVFSGWQTVLQDENGHFLTSEELIGKTGKELINLDADGDRLLDLFAEYEDRYIEYTINFDSRIVEVKKDGVALQSGATLHFGDEFTVSFKEFDPIWVPTYSITSGAKSGSSENSYIIDETAFAGRAVEISANVEHEYLKIELSSSSHKYKVMGFADGKERSEIVIPGAYWDGTQIVKVDSSAFKDNKTLTSVVISEGIEEIDYNAFEQCSSIISLTLPESLRVIDGYAFAYCESLSELNFNEGLEEIGDHAFSGARGITSLTIPASVKNIIDKAFNKCTMLRNVTVNSTEVVIGNSVFDTCTSLEWVLINGSVASIGADMFTDTTSVVAVYFNGTRETWQGISGNENISSELVCYFSATDPYAEGSGLDTTYKYWHFNEADQNTPELWQSKEVTITFDDNIKVSKADGSEVSSGDTVNVGDILTIESNTIEGDWVGVVDEFSGLTKGDGNEYTVTGAATISSKVEHRYLTFTLKDDQTYEVHGMKSGASEINVVIPDNHYDGKAITSIYGYYNSYPRDGDGAFYNNRTIQSVIIGNNVTNIGGVAFYYCSGLTNVTIPNSVTKVGGYAFYDCNGLKEVNYMGDIDQWASIESEEFTYLFYYAKQFKIRGEELPADITINVPVSDYAFHYCTNLKNVTLGENCTSIGKSAFSWCSELRSVTIKNVSNIGEFAFAGNKYISLTIGESVTSIVVDAFEECEKFTEVNYLGTIDQWASINFENSNSNPVKFTSQFKIKGNELPENITINVPVSDYAFYDCTNLKNVTLGENCTSIGEWAFYGCSRLTSITIPDNVTSIGNSAFYYCKGLISVTIGVNVTSIGNSAFYYCNGIEKVYYKGDEAGWTNLQSSKGSNNDELTGAQIYYFVDSSEENPYITNPDDTKLYWHYDEDGVTPTIWTKENQ